MIFLPTIQMCPFMPGLSKYLLALRPQQHWAGEFEKFAKQVTSLVCYWKKSASTALLSGHILIDLSRQLLGDRADYVTARDWMDKEQNAVLNTTLLQPTKPVNSGEVLCCVSRTWCGFQNVENQSLSGWEKIRISVPSTLVLDEVNLSCLGEEICFIFTKTEASYLRLERVL